MLLRAPGPLHDAQQLQSGLAIFSHEAVWVGRGDSASFVNSFHQRNLDTPTELWVRMLGSEVLSSP